MRPRAPCRNIDVNLMKPNTSKESHTRSWCVERFAQSVYAISQACLFISIIKMLVSWLLVLNILATLQALARIMCGSGVDLNALRYPLPGLRTRGWRRRTQAAGPV